LSLSRLSPLYWTATLGLIVANAAVSGRIFTADPAPLDGSALFQRLEDRLVGADAIRLTCRAKSEGTITSNLSAEIALREGNRARIDASGEFRGPVRLSFVADGRTMRLAGSVPGLEQPAPADLRGSVVVGLLHMGLLHNLACLSGNAPLDRADGMVKDWVKATGFKLGRAEMVNGVLAQPLSFKFNAGGTDVGEATLWLRSTDGLPLRRTQTTHFPNGDMHVSEEYERFEVGGTLDGKLFERK
jgi:hypothetical protein